MRAITDDGLQNEAEFAVSPGPASKIVARPGLCCVLVRLPAMHFHHSFIMSWDANSTVPSVSGDIRACCAAQVTKSLSCTHVTRICCSRQISVIFRFDIVMDTSGLSTDIVHLPTASEARAWLVTEPSTPRRQSSPKAQARGQASPLGGHLTTDAALDSFVREVLLPGGSAALHLSPLLSVAPLDPSHHACSSPQTLDSIYHDILDQHGHQVSISSLSSIVKASMTLLLLLELCNAMMWHI